MRYSLYRFFLIILALLMSFFMFACQEDEATYTVNLDLSGGTLVGETTFTVTRHENLVLPTPTKEHYTFAGWTYTVDGETLSVSENYQAIDSDIVLVANWTANTYTVSYMDGAEELSSDTITYPNELTSLYIPSKDGYVFVGWYTEQALTNAYTISLMTSNLVLYAKWEEILPNEYVVQFNSDGGSTHLPITVLEGNYVSELPTPVKEGYTFLGWTLGEDLFDKDQTPITEHMTLVARWLIQTFQVDFIDEMNQTHDILSVNYGQTLVEPEIVDIYNYQFNGWMLEENVYDFNQEVHAPLVLYASYTEIYATEGRYETYATDFESFNPHRLTTQDSITYYKLISDALYVNDYDWDLAISLNLASYRGDFTNHAYLPQGYMPSMAQGEPIMLDTAGLEWRIEIKEGLMFEDETPITAQTFYDSYHYLILPEYQNENAYYMFDDQYLQIENAEAYHNQLQPLKDDLGFLIYDINGVYYSRSNAEVTYVVNHPEWPLYYVDQSTPYIDLLGPNGAIAYVEYWSNFSYGLEGFVVENEQGDPFTWGTDGILYAPEDGWTLDGTPVPFEYPQGVYRSVYAGAFPAYTDENHQFAPVNSLGTPIDGTSVLSPEVSLSSVGFRMVDAYTLELTLSKPVTVDHLKYALSQHPYTVVHTLYYLDAINETAPESTYGTIYDLTYSYGPYTLITHTINDLLFYRNDIESDDYLIPEIHVTLENDLSVLNGLFNSGDLDYFNVPSEYVIQYMENDELIERENNTVFYLKMNAESGVLQNENLRMALSYAFNHEDYTYEYRNVSHVFRGFVSMPYEVLSYAPFTYRQSPISNLYLENFIDDEGNGYSVQLANDYFDLAYNELLTSGVISSGNKIEIHFLQIDSGISSMTPGQYYEAMFEEVFGTTRFDFVIDEVTSQDYYVRLKGGNYDVYVYGLTGTYDALGLLLYLYTDDMIAETSFSVYLPDTKAVIADYNGQLGLTPEEQLFYNEMYTAFDNDTLIANEDILTRLFAWMLEQDYDGVYDDLYKVVAAVESDYQSHFLMIPLHTSVSYFVVSERVGLRSDTYHPILELGGYKYMYLVNQDA